MKIIYIMGYGRSGSTWLNTILGGHPSILAAGELCNIIRAMDIRREYCSCGIRSELCPFWAQVRREWIEVAGERAAADYGRLMGRYERALGGARRWGSRRERKGCWRRYSNLTRGLFEAMRHVSGANVIVDSSKSPARALALSRIEGIDLRVIHLVRDVRGVACSLNTAWKSDPENGIVAPLAARTPSFVTAGWMRVNAGAGRVRRRLASCATLIRYEDLVGDPEATLARIGACVGEDLSNIAKKLIQGGEFRSGHQIAGNRVRMQGAIRLQPDVRWRREFSPLRKLWIWSLASPLAIRYGYRP